MPSKGRDLNVVCKGNLLADEHVQYIAYQMLRGLKYIHASDIVHRDLKPANIAVDENVDLKILDFGLGRDDCSENTDLSKYTMTNYVATRYWRAPEVIIKQTYSKKIDIWSAGIVLYMMLSGVQPFLSDIVP